VGEISSSYAKALHQLRQTHRLGVVSDIWSKKDFFLREFARAGVRGLFDVTVFSSDHGCVKPTRSLFTKALNGFLVDSSRVVFVGDSLQRDITGANAVGLATIWINAAGATRMSEYPRPDHEIRDLQELLKGRE
jgi:HAD superfamily hydrolase (TIGR01549 family)